MPDPSGYQAILSDGTVIWREGGSNVTGEINVIDLHAYWKDPTRYGEKNNFNNEEDYFKCPERSEKLVELFKGYIGEGSKILELGCNVGRNLHYLYQAGYHNLTGIDINSKALQLGKEHYPELADRFICGEIGEVLEMCYPEEFDVIFTMAVLEHIHPQQMRYLADKIGITAKDYVITCEDESAIFWRAFSYNYKKLFEYIGFKELESFQLPCTNTIDNSGNFTLTYRVFKKGKI